MAKAEETLATQEAEAHRRRQQARLATEPAEVDSAALSSVLRDIATKLRALQAEGPALEGQLRAIAAVDAAGRHVRENTRPTNVESADFTGADLRGANFSGSDVSKAKLDRANLHGVIAMDTKWPRKFSPSGKGIHSADSALTPAAMP